MTISQCPWISRIFHACVSRCCFGVNIAAIVEATNWVIHLTPIAVIFSNLPISCSKGRHTRNCNSACSRSLSLLFIIIIFLWIWFWSSTSIMPMVRFLCHYYFWFTSVQWTGYLRAYRISNVTPQTQKDPKHERRTTKCENVRDFFLFFSSPQHMIRINNYTKISILQVRAL